MTGRDLVSPHACCFVSWLLQCTHRKRPCLLLVAVLLHCHALPSYPGDSTVQRSPPLLMLKLCSCHCSQSPGWTVSPVLRDLRHAVGHLRQPWDPRDRARQEPPIGARCPVTPVGGLISGFDYDYDYDYVCTYVCMSCATV